MTLICPFLTPLFSHGSHPTAPASTQTCMSSIHPLRLTHFKYRVSSTNERRVVFRLSRSRAAYAAVRDPSHSQLPPSYSPDFVMPDFAEIGSLRNVVCDSLRRVQWTRKLNKRETKGCLSEILMMRELVPCWSHRIYTSPSYEKRKAAEKYERVTSQEATFEYCEKRLVSFSAYLEPTRARARP
jgi:hypothetical protein